MSEYEQLQRGIAQLREAFPDLSIEEVTSALLRHHLKPEVAAEDLLALSASRAPSSQQRTEERVEPKPEAKGKPAKPDPKAEKEEKLRRQKEEKERKEREEKERKEREKLEKEREKEEKERREREEKERKAKEKEKDKKKDDKEDKQKEKDDPKRLTTKASAPNFRHSLAPPSNAASGPTGGRPSSVSMSAIELPTPAPSLLDLSFDAPTPPMPTLAPTPLPALSAAAAPVSRPRAHTFATPPSPHKVQRQNSAARLTAHFGGLDFFSTSPIPPADSAESVFDFGPSTGAATSPLGGSAGGGARRLGSRNPFAAHVAPPPSSAPPVDPVLDQKARTIQRFLRRTMFRCAFERLLHGIKQRNKVMRELVSSEGSYVDSLAQLNNKYLQQIQSGRILDEEQVRSVFLNTVDLLIFHSGLVRLLSEKLKNWSARQTISDVFVALRDNIGMYEFFVNGYNSNTVAELAKNNKKFAKFLQKTANAPDVAGGVRELSALLICPVQRMPRYMLLLSDLHRSTPEFYPAYEDYVQAADMVSALCAQLNQARGVFDAIGMPHKFRPAHSDRSQWCYYCGRLIWPGLNRQIYFCNQCQQACHKRCMDEGAQREYCIGRRPDSSGSARPANGSYRRGVSSLADETNGDSKDKKDKKDKKERKDKRLSKDAPVPGASSAATAPHVPQLGALDILEMDNAQFEQLTTAGPPSAASLAPPVASATAHRRASFTEPSRRLSTHFAEAASAPRTMPTYPTNTAASPFDEDTTEDATASSEESSSVGTSSSSQTDEARQRSKSEKDLRREEKERKKLEKRQSKILKKQEIEAEKERRVSRKLSMINGAPPVAAPRPLPTEFVSDIGDEELSKVTEGQMQWIQKLKKEKHSRLITMLNNSKYSLDLVYFHEARGKWRRKPDTSVAPGVPMQFGVEGKHSTEGYVCFSVDGSNEFVQCHWTIGPDDHPGGTVVCPPELAMKVSGRMTGRLDERFCDMVFTIEPAAGAGSLINSDLWSTDGANHSPKTTAQRAAAGSMTPPSLRVTPPVSRARAVSSPVRPSSMSLPAPGASAAPPLPPKTAAAEARSPAAGSQPPPPPLPPKAGGQQRAGATGGDASDSDSDDHHAPASSVKKKDDSWSSDEEDEPKQVVALRKLTIKAKEDATEADPATLHKAISSLSLGPAPAGVSRGRRRIGGGDGEGSEPSSRTASSASLNPAGTGSAPVSRTTSSVSLAVPDAAPASRTSSSASLTAPDAAPRTLSVPVPAAPVPAAAAAAVPALAEVTEQARTLMTEAYALLMAGQFADALARVESALAVQHKLSNPRAMLSAIVLCAQYKLALRLLIRHQQLIQEKRLPEAAMLARFLAEVLLKAEHRIVSVKMASRENKGVGNLGTAARYFELALKYDKLTDVDRARLEGELAVCREQGSANAHAGDYTCPKCQQVGFTGDLQCRQCQSRVLLCAESLQPIRSSSYHKCSFCETSFAPDVGARFAASSAPCGLCTFGTTAEQTR